MSQLPWHLPLTRLTVSSRDPELADRFAQALRVWLAGAGTVKPVPQGGLVHINWGPPCAPYAVGWTQPQWHQQWQTGRCQLKHITVIMVKHPRIDAQLTSAQQADRLKATLLHEAGHVLGLDHCDQPTAVMHYRGWQNTHLTPWDKALFQAKYPIHSA